MTDNDTTVQTAAMHKESECSSRAQLTTEIVAVLSLTAMLVVGSAWLSVMSGINIPGPIGLAAVLCAGLGFAARRARQVFRRRSSGEADHV